jgi:conjugative relaxase-like TrwC/TraI family protein
MIMGGSVAQLIMVRAAGGGALAVTMVTPRSGFDLEYYLDRAGGEKTAGGYYLNAAQEGEPPGRWFGKGAEALGFTDGQLVERDPYLAAYQQTDPSTGERLGRAPVGYRRFGQIFARKLAAEPHATWERRLELEREAGQEARRSPVYTDLTVAHNKSVSVLHASFREHGRRARLAGDKDREAVWRAREERVQEILQDANHAALEYLQQHAGFTRTGYHGRRVDGVEPGRWAPAGLVVTTWLQGTSRAGEPHDHSHNVIARMGRTETDGVWRSVDTMALRAHMGAMATIVDARVQSALAREFGVRWLPRADGMGHEIDGITQETLDAFSTRTHTVTRAQLRLAREWARRHGRAPNAREMVYLGLAANKITRGAKDGQIDWDALTAGWDATLGGQLAAIADEACDFQEQPDRNAALPSREVRERVIERALASVQAKNSTWTRSELMKNLAWAMGQDFAHLPPDVRQELLEQLTDQALGVEYGVECLEAPEWPCVPRSLVRELDGRSVYTRPGVTRYATRSQLTMEQRMRQQAQRTGAPALTCEFCATQLGADADVLDAQLGARAQDAMALTPTGLRMDQAAMIYEGLTSTHRVSVGVGPAGSGKTHTVAAGAKAWEANGGKVTGLTCAQAARDVLQVAGIGESYNTSRFLTYVNQGMPIRPGTLFVVDEGSMVSMNHLARIIDLAEHHNCKVLITGDHQQLTAVESGGGMTMLATHLGHTQLAVPVRFAAEWERDASLRLRTGDKTALDAYAEHGRIFGADREQALDQLRQRYVARRLAGEDALLMAHDRQDCRELSRMIRDDLMHLG